MKIIQRRSLYKGMEFKMSEEDHIHRLNLTATKLSFYRKNCKEEKGNALNVGRKDTLQRSAHNNSSTKQRDCL